MKTLLTILILTVFLAQLAISQELTPYLTPHFSDWLNSNGYEDFRFERTDIVDGGSFGGKTDDQDVIVNIPIIFIHGNSDQAIGEPSADFNGFTDTMMYFLSQGYKESELYATTWGPADPALATDQYHSYAYLNYLRNFLEAVLKYIGAEKINIISHSMGVAFGRKIVRGGKGNDGGEYDLGESLASKVDTFLGIAGCNWGMVDCYSSANLPVCNQENGLYPGIAPGPIGLSTFLDNMNKDGVKEGDYVFSMLTTADDVFKYGDLVYNKFTSKIPGSDATKIYTDLTHMQIKRNTIEEQLKIITSHAI